MLLSEKVICTSFIIIILTSQTLLLILQPLPPHSITTLSSSPFIPLPPPLLYTLSSFQPLSTPFSPFSILTHSSLPPPTSLHPHPLLPNPTHFTPPSLTLTHPYPTAHPFSPFPPSGVCQRDPLGRQGEMHVCHQRHHHWSAE